MLRIIYCERWNWILYNVEQTTIQLEDKIYAIKYITSKPTKNSLFFFNHQKNFDWLGPKEHWLMFMQT